LVKFTRPANAPAKVAALGDDLVRETTGDVAVVDPSPGESLGAALAAYRAGPDVAYAEPNRIRYLFAVGPPSDPDYSLQWALSRIDAIGGWSLFPGTFSPAAGAPLAIVDTGVDALHEDLSSRLQRPAQPASAVAALPARLPTRSVTALMSPASPEPRRTTVSVSPVSPSARRSSPYVSSTTTRPMAGSPTTPTWPTGSPGQRSTEPG